MSCFNKMYHHNINLCFFFLPTIILFLSFCSSTKGLIAPLIPPLSPHSPFYTQILEANNISITSNNNNVTLNLDQYMKWLLWKTSYVSLNEKSDVFFLQKAGTHVMSLNLGDPNQQMYGIFDTGSSLTWFPCKGHGESEFPTFNQWRSYSYRIMQCGDRRCRYEGSKKITHCDNRERLCMFDMKYGDKTTAKGVMSFDRVTFENPELKALVQFIFGCSQEHSPDTMGIIGASNSLYSLPQQLNSNDPKFSYCISSDLTKNNLVKFGDDAQLKGKPLNIKINSFTHFYYLDVVGMKVNGQSIDAPPLEFTMSIYGDQGFIIDSGTSITTLNSDIFDALKAKIEHILGPSTQQAESYEICYPSSKFGTWTKNYPVIGLEFYPYYVFEFDGGKIWRRTGPGNLVCLWVRRKPKLESVSQISILGYINLLDYNVGYDPNNKHLYLEKSTCKSS